MLATDRRACARPAEPLGWPRLRELVALTSIPVYALGGMTVDTLTEARDAGAYGIAAIRSLWP
jgi:thiamine-phosphate pyrophosphorylase